MWPQSRNTLKNARLLQHIGREPWDLGWNRLWAEPCLYLSFPLPLRACKHGTVIYVGETVSFRRRFEEDILPLLDIDRQTQQPFYTYVRQGCDSESQLLATVSFLMLVPVCTASSDRARRLEEASMIASFGSLNPPRVQLSQESSSYSFRCKRAAIVRQCQAVLPVTPAGGAPFWHPPATRTHLPARGPTGNVAFAVQPLPYADTFLQAVKQQLLLRGA